jgi:anti-anti-sigma factor
VPIRYDQYNRVGVLSPDGDLKGDDVARLREAVADALDARRVTSFVVDLTNTRFIDSEGLEALLWARRRCGGAGESGAGQIRLAAADENCRKILEVTRLDHRFECHADLAGAIRTLS